MPRGKHSRKQRGGNVAPDSSWGSVFNNYGDGWTQFMNALTLQPGANAASASSNQIVPIGKINANDPSVTLLKQTGGKTRKRGRGKKGGFLGIGAILEQAVVPFALLGMQNSYGKSKRAKNSGSKRSRRNR